MRGDLAETRRALKERDNEVRRMRRSVVACCAAALTLLLHVLLISPLLWGRGHSERKPIQDEGGATSGVPTMTLVMLDDADNPPDAGRQPFEKLSEIVSPSRVLVPVGSLHLADNLAQPAIEEPGAHTENEPSTNEGERALMFGRYLGQVTARIQRAWLRPRSPIGPSSFTCLVQVEQDKERNVREVQLKECNGTTAWQLSLVQAIESASPFPAPPDPAVFSRMLTFEMASDGFVQGGSTDGFVPDTATTMR